MERKCVNWTKQNRGVIRQLWIGLFPLVHRSLGLLFRVLLLIPALLFSGVASQARSQIPSTIAPVATPESWNLPDAPPASHGAEPSALAPFPWLREVFPRTHNALVLSAWETNLFHENPAIGSGSDSRPCNTHSRFAELQTSGDS